MGIAFVFSVIGIIAWATTGYGQEQAQAAPGFWELIASGEFIAKATPLVIAGQVLLRGVAEGLTRISVLTENKWDNKLARWASDAAWISGVVIGKFGVGTPKLVVEEYADKATTK